MLKKFNWEPDNGGKAANNSDGNNHDRMASFTSSVSVSTGPDSDKKCYVSIAETPRMKIFEQDLEQR